MLRRAVVHAKTRCFAAEEGVTRHPQMGTAWVRVENNCLPRLTRLDSMTYPELALGRPRIVNDRLLRRRRS
jgi:hypothetical protein